ncbi:antirestriction protein ArdA [Anaerobutyricum hallii]|uniref:Antirestriction protein ArdA n=1 Tax=Anaerobutyricum hallii TaxID=39488 RepID=A0A413PXK0_9FIRM|nr:antirestriction protein ArdA [Anaerobutyricum hallii]
MIDDMAVYIANLGKYNEGYLVGAWFTFPIDEEDVKEKIGLNEQYEEYAIHDTDNFPIAIGEYVSIEELNEMYEMIEELPDYIVECLDEFISHYGTLEEVVEHKDDIYYYPDCETMTDVAYYYIDELQALGDIPPSLQNYIDYEAYGRDLDMGGCFIETSEGYARYHINAGRSATAWLLLTAYFSFKGQSENGCPFLFEELTKGAERT